jgi:hypothetical protein
MAQLNFPDNPIDGQLYPNPCPAGVTQYKWDVASGIWRIVGVATGVTPGTFGDNITVGQFTVDVAGKITAADNIPIRDATVNSSGVVRLNDSASSLSITQALTARVGKSLQDQIGNLNNCIVPDHANIVSALNDLQNQNIELQTNAMIWCGYYNALEGDISFVSITGQRLGYVVGQELPLPSAGNGGDFFIVTESGNPYAAGDFNAPDKFIEAGNWIISEAVRWSEVKAKGNLAASDISCFTLPPLTANNVQGAITQLSQLIRTGGIGGATISINPPASPYQGQLWWDNERGYFYIYYRDPNGDQWVEIGGGGSDALQSGGGGIVLLETGVGLQGGPITSEGKIALVPATKNTLGGFIPGRGLTYEVATGLTGVSLSANYNSASPDVAFSQAGANALATSIQALSGANVLAGTYNAQTGLLVYATPAGVAKGFKANDPLPVASRTIDNYYVIVTVGGNFGPDGVQPSGAGDWWLCQADDNTLPSWFLIDFENLGAAAENVTVNRISGIDFASNVQTALEAIELQVQGRIEFAQSTTEGLTVTVSDPDPNDNDGTRLEIGVNSASLTQKGIVQLTSDVTGNSESLAITQLAASGLNSKISAIAGANVLAGTYNANTGRVTSVTPAGASNDFIVGINAPDAAKVRDNYYLIVTVGGGFGPPGASLPPGGVQPGDWFIVENEPTFAPTWVTIDFDNRTTTASLVAVTPIPNLSATDVQNALLQIEDQVDNTITGVLSQNGGITVEITPANASFGFNSKLTLNPATPTGIGGVFVAPNNGLILTQAGGLSVSPATKTVVGGVKVGSGLDISGDGTISLGSGVGTVTSVNASGGDTGMTFSGGPIQTFGTLTLDGTLNVTSGGTGANSATGALTNLLPSQSGNAGKVLTTNGSTVSWGAGGGGGVQSITFQSPLTGGTISNTGTVGIQVANASQDGVMTAAYASQVDKLPLNVGTNSSGNRFVSSSTPTPSDGVNGDIWYVV